MKNAIFFPFARPFLFPRLSGCILFAPQKRTCHNFNYRNTGLLSNGRCSVTEGRITYRWVGGTKIQETRSNISDTSNWWKSKDLQETVKGLWFCNNHVRKWTFLFKFLFDILVPLPPHDVTGSQLHKDDDRNFEIVFTEPKNGQWDHFEVTAYETKNIQKSNEGILQDKTIVLPMRLDNAGSFIMYFSHFQTEYTVEICTVNTFGRKSFGSSKVTIITGFSLALIHTRIVYFDAFTSDTAK